MEELATFSEQLAELRRTRFSKVPRVRYVMQSFLASAKHSEENRAEARTRVLDWARHHWPGLIPPQAYEGMAFEHDQAGLRIAATSNTDGTLWAFRSEHLGDLSRNWVTEAVIADLGVVDGLGVRNSCSTLGSDPVPTSSPRFLRDFVASHNLLDAEFPVKAASHLVADGASFEEFLGLLLSPDRVLPIVVLTQLPDTTDYAINPTKLARDTQGLAHVFCMLPNATFDLTDRLGRKLSVFDGAVRTYYPGFSEEADPWQHHLVFPQRIGEWIGEEATGPDAFERFISEQLHFFSVNAPDKIETLPSYFTIRRALLDKPNKTTDEEIQYLRLELEDARAKEAEWKAIADDRDAEANTTEEENRRLDAQNRVLAEDLRTLRKARGEEVIPIPDTYEVLPGWVDSYFADRLVLHSRAVRALKGAVFKDVGLVCQSLQLLAETYWAMRGNTDPSQRLALVDRWEEGLKALGLEFNSHSLAENRLGEFRDQYTIDYRIGQKPKQILGPHLKYGSTKDDHYCMRIYFIWDDEKQLVVVGHLPSHLDTRAT